MRNELGLMATFKPGLTSSCNGSIIVRIMEIEPGGRIINCYTAWDSRGIWKESEYYDHLEAVHAIIDGRPCGWTLEYENVNAGLSEAQKMVKTLKRINNGLNRLTKRLGWPGSFAEYVLRLADVLKIKKEVRQVQGTSPYYSENEYRILPVTHIKDHINDLVAETKKEVA